MFSDDFTINRDKDGYVFIDRSGEHFNFILDYLRGNIVGIDDILFDENTRKKLIKEAEYYQLEGMKNILAFKSSSRQKENECDCKAEVIEIVENVIQNKEAIRNVLDESKSVERNVRNEENLSSIEDLNLAAYLYSDEETYFEATCYRTISSMTFENKIWDGVDFKGASFEHSITLNNAVLLIQVSITVNSLKIRSFLFTVATLLTQVLHMQISAVKFILMDLI